MLLVTFVGGIWAFYTYLRNSRLRRAEWLLSVYEKFYEQDHYKRIRHVIDFQTSELDKLGQGLEAGGGNELVELFVDYLNFFEFIASLWRLRQLSLDEIRMMFEYYLMRLTDFEFIMRFIRAQGFETLRALLIKIQEAGQRRPC